MEGNQVVRKPVLPWRIGLLVISVALAAPHGNLVAKAEREEPPPAPSGNSLLLGNYWRASGSFETNAGQVDADVKFLSRGLRHSLFLTPQEVVLDLWGNAESGQVEQHLAAGETSWPGPANGASRQGALRIRFVGGNRQPRLTGLEETPGRSNYFIGNDPKNWRTGVTTYAKVKYEAIYPGVDLIFHADQEDLEYDFVVAPGADPGAICIEFRGADSMKIGAEGDLILHTAAGEIRQHKPIVYQEIEGTKHTIPAEYAIRGNDQVGFRISPINPTRPLVIDPVLSYSTYLGGQAEDDGAGIGLDADGNIYVVGAAASANFPTANALQPSNAGGFDVVVLKLNAAGDTLLYSTYIGGSGPNDFGMSLAVDSSGRASITGVTDSPNFPTTSSAYDTSCGTDGTCNGGVWDGFVARLSSDGGTLLYSTYLGGSGDDRGIDIALGSSGNAYVTGSTASSDFPTASPLQASYAGGLFDAFVSRLDTTASGSASLVYSTFLGGTDQDRGVGIAVDGSGRIYLTGRTASTDFPTSGAIQASNAGGAFDAYAVKLNAAGSSFFYSTYLGGNGDDRGRDIAVDTSGRAYMTGSTVSTDFPVTAGAFDTSCGTDGSCDGGRSDAFVAKLSTAGSTLEYATFLGGKSDDHGEAIAVNSSGVAHLAGYTDSTDFPLANPFQPTCGCGGGFIEAFVTKLDASGGGLLWSSYLGGSSSDYGAHLALDQAGNVFVTGEAYSSDFPMQNPIQSQNAGHYDLFISKIVVSADLAVANTDTPDPVSAGANLTYTVHVTNNGPDAATGVRVTDTLPDSVTYVSAAPTQGSCSQSGNAVTCNLGSLANAATATVTIAVVPAAAGTISNTVDVTGNETDSQSANNTATQTTTVNATAIRGDANGDGSTGVTDIFYLINYLFASGPAPATTCGGDANSDGSISATDIFFLINNLFAGGPGPGPC